MRSAGRLPDLNKSSESKALRALAAAGDCTGSDTRAGRDTAACSVLATGLDFSNKGLTMDDPGAPAEDFFPKSSNGEVFNCPEAGGADLSVLPNPPIDDGVNPKTGAPLPDPKQTELFEVSGALSLDASGEDFSSVSPVCFVGGTPNENPWLGFCPP